MMKSTTIRTDKSYNLTTKPSNNTFIAHFVKLEQTDMHKVIVDESLNFGYLTKEEAKIGQWCYSDGENLVGVTTIKKWSERTDWPEDVRSKDTQILKLLRKLNNTEKE